MTAKNAQCCQRLLIELADHRNRLRRDAQILARRPGNKEAAARIGLHWEQIARAQDVLDQHVADMHAGEQTPGRGAA